MTEEQTVVILDEIYTLYPNYLGEDRGASLDYFHKYLQYFDYETVSKNLAMHVMKETRYPRIADLTGGNKQKEVRQAIPNVAETRQYLLEQQLALPAKPSDPEYIARLREQAMKEIARGAAMNAARNPRKEWHPDDELQ